MHFVLATVGTEGDVRPFVALARGLVSRGHRCTIATHTDYEGLVTRHGLGFRTIGASFKAIVESDAGRRWIESSDRFLRYLRATRETFGPVGRAWAEDAYRASVDADMVLAHPYAMGATFAAEAKGRPAAVIALPPWVPSGQLEPVGLPTAPRWPWLRHTLGRLALRGIGDIVIPHLDAVRATVGLPSIAERDFISFALARGFPVLHLFSSHLVPRPPDWPELASVTGFCFLDEDREPPATLTAFLAAGPPPIYIGFGSMTGKDPQALAELSLAAVRRAGERAVLVTGWSGARTDGGDDVHVIDRVSHDWLMPHVKAVVHHGGAGTTAAGLRAGRPTLVVAFFGDQPFFGHRVAAVGAGPLPLRKRDLTVDSLAAAIRHTVSTSRYQDGARRVAAGIQAEDGVRAAVERVLAHAR